MLSERDYYSRLKSIYGALLTPRQKQVLELFLDQDLNLAEIGEILGISRQGVHDLLRRSLSTLGELEEKLSFLKKLEEIKNQVCQFIESNGESKEGSFQALGEFFDV